MAPLDVSGEHRLRSENLAFDIDVWYPPLARHTFATTFLPLTREEAAAIVAYHDASWRSARAALTLAEVGVLEALEARIDEALASGTFVDGAFLRLCGRSPKDGEPTCPDRRAELRKGYERALQRLLAQGQPKDGNTRLAAVADTPSWLRVRSGADAMNLLLTSERVFVDMRDWLEHGEPEQIVLREWSDGFKLSSEFRCYVERGVLKAISQYDHHVMYQELQQQEPRQRIADALVAEWQKIKGCIETRDDSYCADFGVDTETGKAQLIELSPFRGCTGAALFSWAGTASAPLLRTEAREGMADLPLVGSDSRCVDETAVLRVRSAAVPGIESLVEANWDERWSEARHDAPQPFRELYTKAVGAMQEGSGARSKAFFAGGSVLVGGGLLFHYAMAALIFAGVCVLAAVTIAPRPEPPSLLFVYGTLKRGMHWHSKHLSRARYVCDVATAEPQTLVLGDCGVPLMLRNDDDGKKSAGKHVRGELFALDAHNLRGIDEYEGVGKGHYERESIRVALPSGKECQASCYFGVFAGSSAEQPATLAEFTAEHHEQYRAIEHIQVKQLHYLREE